MNAVYCYSKQLIIRILLSTTLVALHASAYADGAEEVVWIDVRSSAEHWLDNIDGDPRIPYTDIVEQVSILYPDKSTELRLYCRSGGRAGKAVEALQAAGYSNASNMGGIDDVRKLRSINEQINDQ